MASHVTIDSSDKEFRLSLIEWLVDNCKHNYHYRYEDKPSQIATVTGYPGTTTLGSPVNATTVATPAYMQSVLAARLNPSVDGELMIIMFQDPGEAVLFKLTFANSGV